MGFDVKCRMHSPRVPSATTSYETSLATASSSNEGHLARTATASKLIWASVSATASLPGHGTRSVGGQKSPVRILGAKGSRRGQARDRTIDAQEASSESYHLVGGDRSWIRGTTIEKASY